MKKHFSTWALFVGLFVVGIAGVSSVLADTEVSLADVPEAVLNTIQDHAGDGEIAEVEKETKDGKIVYEAEVVVDGEEMDIMVSETGEYLGTEMEEEDDEDGDENENETSISMEDAPEAVQAALADLLRESQIDEISCEAEDGHMVYEASYEADGAEHEVGLTEDGYLLESETEIGSDALPPAVAAAVAAEYPDSEIDDASVVQRTLYEVEVEVGEKTIEMTILANGQIVETEED